MTTDLKSILDATADALTLNPAAGAARFEVGSDLLPACQIDVNVGGRIITVDQPEALGGRGYAPNPVEYALTSLGSCVATTYRFWSEKLGIELDSVHIDVRGELDVRGIFGVSDDVRPGFGTVEVDVQVTGPESPERYEELRRVVDEHSPVLDVFANAVPVRTALTVG